MNEIERKFLVTLKDYLGAWEFKVIEQYYTHISDEQEIRYRRKGNKFFKTEKIGNGLSRKENEHEISEEEYKINEADKIGNLIKKTRYEKNGWELDEYISPTTEYYVLEKEFSSVEESENYELPKEVNLIKEITEDKRYKNKNLALNGFPKNGGDK